MQLLRSQENAMSQTERGGREKKRINLEKKERNSAKN
jgi:hypothetical protein